MTLSEVSGAHEAKESKTKKAVRSEDEQLRRKRGQMNKSTSTTS